MIRAKRNNDATFPIWGAGTPIREWLYIDDLVTILEKSLTLAKDLVFPVNIAQNKGYSIKSSAEMIAKAVGFSGILQFDTRYPDGDPKKVLDDKRFREIFPDFTFTDHLQGIINTVQYYQSVL